MKKKKVGNKEGVLPYAKGSDTSKAAALRMMEEAKTLRDRVEAVILMGGKRGKTTEEIEEFLGRKHQSISPRVWELKGNNGYEQKVFDSGIRAANQSGDPASLIVHNRFDQFHPRCPKCGNRERGYKCECNWEEQDAAEAARSK